MIELATLQAASYIMGSLGVFVAAVYYVLNIQNNMRNQKQTLETRQVQLYMQIHNQGTNNRNFIESFLRVQSLEWGNAKEFLDLMDYNNPETRENAIALSTLIGYYEGVGMLVRENMLSVRWVALLFGGWTRMLWEKIAPVAEEVREYNKAPRTWSETEYLYKELMRYMEEHPELKT